MVSTLTAPSGTELPNSRTHSIWFLLLPVFQKFIILSHLLMFLLPVSLKSSYSRLFFFCYHDGIWGKSRKWTLTFSLISCIRRQNSFLERQTLCWEGIWISLLLLKSWKLVFEVAGCWGLPGGPVVKNLPCYAGDAGSILGQGIKLPHNTTRESMHHNQRSHMTQQRFCMLQQRLDTAKWVIPFLKKWASCSVIMSIKK